MKNIYYYLLILLSFLLSSCGGASKKTAVISSKKSTYSAHSSAPNKKIKSIVGHAKAFSGTPYKYGGTTRKGMDCSGLVYTSFKKENVTLPRTSRNMAAQGTSVSLKKVAIGDLLFFKTIKGKNTISHVGIVVQTKGGIKFIHSSSKKGVIISSLEDSYWNPRFVKAKRML
ncbi:C40 family peptidase [Aquimarina pacifica]|uniref:C40 family peptidase n=1 Tax=Aquimarina pacifica TaxID=1296415 RepID=UPI0004B5C732|nr:C40 family peptidase [Aquimarina pacifica]